MRIFSASWLSKLKSVFGKTYYRQKFLSSNVTSVIADLADLRFEGLTIGRKYRITGKLNFSNAGAGGVGLGASSNGVNVFSLTGAGGGGDTSASNIFTAQATSLIVNTSADGDDIMYGNGTLGNTYMILEELPNHEDSTTL